MGKTIIKENEGKKKMKEEKELKGKRITLFVGILFLLFSICMFIPMYSLILIQIIAYQQQIIFAYIILLGSMITMFIGAFFVSNYNNPIIYKKYRI